VTAVLDHLRRPDHSYFGRGRSVIAAALLALLAGGQEWSAQWELDRVNNVVLVVTHDGKKHVIKEGRWAPLETHRFRSVSGNGKVRFQGRTYIGKGGQIIDLNSGKSLDMPHPQAPPTGGIGVFRSKGGLALRDRMFWIFSWDNVDQMFEPPIQAFAYEVFARDGALRVGRTTELHTLTKYDGVIGGWHGYIPILSGSSLAIVAGSQFVEFDLAAGLPSSVHDEGACPCCAFGRDLSIGRPSAREVVVRGTGLATRSQPFARESDRGLDAWE
jgi:hypothetical protein